MKDKTYLLAINAGVYPNTRQTSLLKACLLSGDSAINSCNDWINSLEIDLASEKAIAEIGLPQVYDRLDFGSQRLLSLLYKNLTNQGYKHPVIQKLSSYYKYVWYKNNILKARLFGLVKDFELINVEFIITKGIVQIEKYYSDNGMRPTVDIDIVIRQEDIKKSVELLLATGWKSKHSDPKRITQSQLHAHTFYSEQIELDFHFHFSAFSLLSETEKRLWAQSIKQKEGYRILRPAHELFITLLHGQQWNIIPSIRWVADSVKLLNHFSDDEWFEFINLVNSENFGLYQMLKFLTDHNLVSISPYKIELLKGKQNDSNIDSQILTALKNSRENDFVFAKRLFFAIQKKYGSNFTIGLKAWLDHYLYFWDVKNYGQLFLEGFKKMTNKIFTQSKRMINN